MTKAQRKLLYLIRRGHRLMWSVENGPELVNFPWQPQKRTVMALMASGVLRWGYPENETQRQDGCCPIYVSEE